MWTAPSHKNWRYISTNASDHFIDKISTLFHSLEFQELSSIPSLRNTDRIFIGSDYGGNDKSSSFLSYSFIICDLNSLENWIEANAHIRRNFLGDNRRMAYKKLNDGKRSQALVPFLNAANQIDGMVFTLLLDKQIDSYLLFQPTPDHSPTPWKKGPFIKAILLCNLVSMLISGLACSGQKISWSTDHDEIVSNTKQINELERLLGFTLSKYIGFIPPEVKFGTAQADLGEEILEDLLSLPDLAAGAMGDLFTKARSEVLPAIGNGLFLPPPQNVKEKLKSIAVWHMDLDNKLKKHVAVMQKTGNVISGNFIRFDRKKT
jgi:hypothetical protein